MVGTLQPLITLVAVDNDEKYDGDVRMTASPSSAQQPPVSSSTSLLSTPPRSSSVSPSPSSPDLVVRIEEGHATSSDQGGGRKGRIVGVVIAQILPTEGCEEEDLVWPPNVYTEVSTVAARISSS